MINNDEKEELQRVEEEKSYKIYNYMEKHHSLLIAIVSAIVAVGSLFMNVLIYIYQCIVLQRWNVSMELVGEIRKGKFFYIAILGAVYYFCVPFCQMCMQKVIKKYYLYFPMAKIQNQISKKIYRLKRVKGRVKKKEWKEEIKDLRKCINEVKKEAKKKMLGLVIGVGVLFVFCLGLFQVSLGNVEVSTLVLVGGMIFVIVLGMCFFSIRRLIDRSKIKEFKKATKKIASRSDAIKLMNEVMDYQKSIISVKETKRTIKELVCDKNIGTFVEFMAETFICLCMFFVLSGIATAKMQKDFWVFKDESGKSHAIIYQDEERAIMKEAEIIENVIKIYLDRQLITTLCDNKIEYMKFDSVECIEENK